MTRWIWYAALSSHVFTHQQRTRLPACTAAPLPAGVGGGRPAKPLESTQIDAAKRHTKLAFDDGKTLTYTELYAAVAADRPLLPLPSISVFRRYLRAAGLRFLRCGKVVPKQPLQSAEVRSLRSAFVVRMSEAFSEEAAGNAVVVWMDESFVHQHHKREGTVVDKSQPEQYTTRRRASDAATVRVSGGGRLFMVIHACTKDGLLVHEVDGKRPLAPDKDNTCRPLATAEWVWRSDPKNKDADYHKHVTADTIVKWAKNRLFPALRAKYPGKRIWLVLDNAKTHKAHEDGHISARSSTKKAITDYLWERGVRTITVRDSTDQKKIVKRFKDDTWELNAPKGPSVAEVRTYLRDYYAERPHSSVTKLQRLFLEEVRPPDRALSPSSVSLTALSRCVPPSHVVCRPLVFCALQSTTDGRRSDGERHQLIFTPPYESESTPIEKVWAKMKQFVASVHFAKRKPDQVLTDIREGFYGGQRCSGVSAADVQSYIVHAKKTMTQWIQEVPLLREAFGPVDAVALTMDAFGAYQRARYKQQNTYVISFDSDTESSDSDGDTDAPTAAA